MNQLRRLASQRQITPLGWIVVVLFALCIALGTLGPQVVRAPAFIAGVLVLLGAVCEGLGMARFGGSLNVSLGERRERMTGTVEAAEYVSAPAEADEAAWQRERVRREEQDRTRR